MDNQDQQAKERFETERDRLVDALGKITEGGIIQAIEHIGATSVPGLYGSRGIDIGMAVWPFPLEAGPRARLEALGYRLLSGYEGSPEQRFRHEPDDFQLCLVEFGAARWYDMLLVRDYLRSVHTARDAFSEQKKTGAVPTSELFARTLPAAHEWWISYHRFSPVDAVVNELKDAPFLWYISSGWALDLFLGQVDRVHHDVDVVVPRSAQMKLQHHLIGRGWGLVTPFENRLELWLPDMPLEPPRHQVHAHRGDDFIDFLLTEIDEVWVYRREPLVIRSPERMGLSTPAGIPYLAPELALLFKSKNTSNKERPQDQQDFERVLPHLEPERRAWLRWALVATSPDHPWITHLI